MSRFLREIRNVAPAMSEDFLQNRLRLDLARGVNAGNTFAADNRPSIKTGSCQAYRNEEDVIARRTVEKMLR